MLQRSELLKQPELVMAERLGQYNGGDPNKEAVPDTADASCLQALCAVA